MMTRSARSGTAWTFSLALLASSIACARGVDVGFSDGIAGDDAEGIPSFDASTIDASNATPPSPHNGAPHIGPIPEEPVANVDAALVEPIDDAATTPPMALEASIPDAEPT